MNIDYQHQHFNTRAEWELSVCFVATIIMHVSAEEDQKSSMCTPCNIVCC